MKKNYMKPQGAVVTMNLDENIAASGTTVSYGVNVYTDPATGLKYINHTNIEYVEMATPALTKFWNYFLAISQNADPNCGVNA